MLAMITARNRAGCSTEPQLVRRCQESFNLLTFFIYPSDSPYFSSFHMNVACYASTELPVYDKQTSVFKVVGVTVGKHPDTFVNNNTGLGCTNKKYWTEPHSIFTVRRRQRPTPSSSSNFHGQIVVMADHQLSALGD